MSCGGDGVLTIIHEDSPDKYTVTQNLPTAKGARTMAMDYAINTALLFSYRAEKGITGRMMAAVGIAPK